MMRILLRQRKYCVLCGDDAFPPVYALQHFYELVGRGNNSRRVPCTPKTVQVETKGTLCWSCVYGSYVSNGEVTRGYIATRNRILEIATAISLGNTQIDRTALFYVPLGYSEPEFWDI